MFGTASRYMRNGQFQPPGGPSTQMTPAGPGGYQPQGGGPAAGGGVAGGGMQGPAGAMGGAFEGGAGPGGMPGGPVQAAPPQFGGGNMAGGPSPYQAMQGGPVQAAPPQFGGGRTAGPGMDQRNYTMGPGGTASSGPGNMAPGGGPPSGPIMAAPPSFGPGMQAGGGAFTGQMPQGPQTTGGYNVTSAGTQQALGAGGNLYDPTQGGRAAGGGGQFEKNDGMIQTAAGGLPPRLANAVSEGRMSLSQAAQRFGKFQGGTLGQGGQAPGQTEPAIGQTGPPPPGQGGANPGVRPQFEMENVPPEKKQYNPGMTKLDPGAYRPRGGGPAGGGVAGTGGGPASGGASGGMAGGSLGGNLDKSKITVGRPGAGKGPMPINKPRPGGLSKPGVQPGGGNPTDTMVPGPGGQPPGSGRVGSLSDIPSGNPWYQSPGAFQGAQDAYQNRQAPGGDLSATTGDMVRAMPKQPPTTATPDIGGGQQSPMAQALMKRKADQAAQRYQQM